MSDTPMNGGTV
jgi:hypothetical protein